MCGRYDMLCFEGIALNLEVFTQILPSLPNFRLVSPPGGELQTLNVKEDVSYVRTLASITGLTLDRQ